jgi:hypothetical protein
MIIIFNGPPRTGKDESCLYLKDNKNFKHIEFKDALFEETYSYFNVTKEWFMDGYSDRSVKERKETILGDRSRRDALIHVSEDVIKPKYGKDYFGVKVSEKLETSVDYCFSDGGFREEIFPIINKVGANNICLVQLTREGCDFSNDSRRYLDGNLVEEFVINKKTNIIKSHILPEKFSIKTYRIHNNGSVKELHETIKTIYEKERNAQEGKKNLS